MDDKTIRMLLIEDSEDDEFLLMRHLKKNDFLVTHRRVQTADEIHRALIDETWDIIISDYSMPGFTGMEALEIVKQFSPDLPFIMVSGAIGEERAAQVMKSGASDYVTKGNYARLIPAIERELRDYAQRLANRDAEAQIYTLSAALAQSASLVIIFNVDDTIAYVNDTFLRITGYDYDEVVGSKADFLRTDVLPASIYDTMWKTVTNGDDWRGELLNKKKNGETFWVSVTLSSIRDENNNITHYLAVQEDVTERKELEAELQRYNETLQEMVEERTEQLRVAKDQMEVILENSSDGIVLAEATGDILTANPAFKTLFNGSVKRSIEELVHLMPSETETRSFAEALISVIYDNSNERTQTSYVTDEGEQIDLDLAFAPVQTDTGKVEALVLSVRDITLVKDLERLKSQFLANAAHDLANPIAALKMRLYLLKAAPDKMDNHVEVLERQIDRMERLVDELRLLEEFDRGVITLNKQEADISPLIEHVIEDHEPIASANSIALTYEKSVDLPHIPLDTKRFDRVIVNLVSNAITYTRDGGEVFVRTSATDSYLILEVEDTGIGIAPDSISKIFDRFYRTTRARKKNDRGTGLGLAIVKELVEAHGGTITVHSVLEKGTTFTVQLPLA